MKKYILPIGILLISIFFLNTAIEPKEPEKASKSETNEEGSRLVPDFKADGVPDEKPLLIYEGNDFSIQLTKDDVETEAKKVKPLEVEPYQHAWLKFEEYPENLTISEWAEGEESQPENSNSHETGGLPGVKILLIRTQRRDKSVAVYLAKVRVKNLYSYQKHLSPNKNNYTVIGFFAADDEKIAMPLPQPDFYDVRPLQGNLELLQHEFPELDIQKLPSYYIFKKRSVLHKTEDYKELVAYLNQENSFTFEGKSENWEVSVVVHQNLRTTKQDIAFRYTGKADQPPTLVNFDLSGMLTGWSQESVNLDKDGKYAAEIGMDIERPQDDVFTCILKWDGKEEQVAVLLKEDAN